MQVWNWCNRVVSTRSFLMPHFREMNGEPPVIMVHSKKMLGSALFITVLVRIKALFLNENGGAKGGLLDGTEVAG